MLCFGQSQTEMADMMREVALIAGLALVISLGYSWLNSARAAQPSVGEAAPAFRLQDQNGTWQRLGATARRRTLATGNSSPRGASR